MGAMLLCSHDNKLWPIYVGIVKVTIIYWKFPCLIPFSFRMISSSWVTLCSFVVTRSSISLFQKVTRYLQSVPNIINSISSACINYFLHYSTRTFTLLPSEGDEISTTEPLSLLPRWLNHFSHTRSKSWD